VLDIWWGTDVALKIKQQGNGVSDIYGGTDAALQKNSEATVLQNMDEGTDAATQKKSEATVFWTFGEATMQRCKTTVRQRCFGHLRRNRCSNAKKERGNGVLDIWLGNDVTLQNNSEAPVLSKLDEGTDVALRKMSEAAMFWKTDEGSDATLQKNRQATVFPKTDEGTDVPLQKMSQATMHPVRCAPAKKWGGSFVWNVLTNIRIRLMPYALCQKKIQNFEISNSA
jgi:hypothetical protein